MGYMRGGGSPGKRPRSEVEPLTDPFLYYGEILARASLVNHCISHVKDADGLCSAALTLAARGGTFRLTDYDQLIDELDGVPKDATELVLCDLGTDPSRF